MTYVEVDFLGDKVSRQLENAQFLEDFSPDRFGALLFDLHYIEKSPWFGNGFHESTRYADHPHLQGEALGHGNGLSNFVATLGTVGLAAYLLGVATSGLDVTAPTASRWWHSSACSRSASSSSATRCSLRCPSWASRRSRDGNHRRCRAPRRVPMSQPLINAHAPAPNMPATDTDQRIADALQGKAIYGDDFTSEEVAKWFADEEHGYSSLDHIDSLTEHYAYHQLDASYVWKYVDRATPSALGLGSAFGSEFKPLAGRIDALTIVEPERRYWRDEVAGIPTRYVAPDPSGGLPFADDSFDLVTAFGVLHHIRTSPRCLQS